MFALACDKTTSITGSACGRHLATATMIALFFSFMSCGGTIIFGSLAKRKTPISSAQDRFRRCWQASVGTAERRGWVVVIEVGDRLSAAGEFRTVKVRHENDSSPTIFEICGSLSRRAFSVLSGVSVICVLES